MKFTKGAIEIAGTLILFVIVVSAALTAIYFYAKTQNSFDCGSRVDTLATDLENKFITFNSGTSTGQSRIEDWKMPKCVICGYVDTDIDGSDEDRLVFELEGFDDRSIDVTGYNIIPPSGTNMNQCDGSGLTGGRTYSIIVTKDDSIDVNIPITIEFERV